MRKKTIYFISTNKHKIEEAQLIFMQKKLGVQVEKHDAKDIKEIQSKDMKEIVLDKAMKAYMSLRRPLFVEHTGLMIEDFGDLPGGLTQVFWSSFLPPDADNTTDAGKLAANMSACKNFCRHFGGKEVTAVTWVAFCDGHQIKTFQGEIKGTIPTTPLGESHFQWDPVFVPEGYSQSFAQMKEEGREEKEKNEISMRRKALDQLAEYLDQLFKDNPDYLSETTNQHIHEIKELIEADKLILFIGAGVSKPLELPDWNELIGQLAKELGYNDPKVFALYGDNLTLAEYYKIAKNPSGSSTPLTDWMKKNLTIDKVRIESSAIHKEIAKLRCSIVYTTNYEEALEEAFAAEGRKHQKIAKIEDLASIPADAIQIVKFHGDMNDEESIVLAERDYFERLNFDTPLDIKLRADMLTKSILFLGYSMSDINIRLLSHKLDRLWKESRNADKRPKSYIFMAQPNPIQEKIFQARGITPIVGEDADPTASLQQFLHALNN